MAYNSVDNNPEVNSNENSISTKEFLHLEKSCAIYKDSDEEIKTIFNEIHKLSGPNHHNDSVIGEELDDVELILKRAENLALETQNILKHTPEATVNSFSVPNNAPNINRNDTINIPVIKVTKPKDIEESKDNFKPSNSKTHQTFKQNGNNDVRRKQKTRPFSAGVIDAKRKEVTKISKTVTNSPKKSICKHNNVIEELKDTNERAKSLELLNVQLTNDIKALRKKLDQVNEEKHVGDLKLAECEKFIGRLGKEYDNRNTELKMAKENESRLLAELNKERNERKNLALQHEKGATVVQDLQRQCKEMEMILKRKHPDSVSALIVAAKSSTVEDNKKKLLEERIARLEQELKDKEDYFQGILITLQEKFGDMKQKYENHIIDVERQLMEDRRTSAELKNKQNKTNLVNSVAQTNPKSQHTVSTQTFLKPSERASSAVNRLTQNSTLLLNKLKEDSYLVATIKGLQSELTVKQRTIAKINRETEELRKNLRNLQKEKEVLITLNPQKKVHRQVKSAENMLVKLNSELETELFETQKQMENSMQERNNLILSLKRCNEEFIVLKKKRVQDLHTLQLTHEKELMEMNMQLCPMQEEIQLLNRTVEILQERLRNSDDKLLKYQAGARDVDINAGGDNQFYIKSKKDSR